MSVVTTHSMIASGTDNNVEAAVELVDWYDSSAAMSGLAATCAALTLAAAATL